MVWIFDRESIYIFWIILNCVSWSQQMVWFCVVTFISHWVLVAMQILVWTTKMGHLVFIWEKTCLVNSVMLSNALLFLPNFSGKLARNMWTANCNCLVYDHGTWPAGTIKSNWKLTSSFHILCCKMDGEIVKVKLSYQKVFNTKILESNMFTLFAKTLIY